VVEHFLAKEDVARSNRVTRSIPCQYGRDFFMSLFVDYGNSRTLR
jgi:hypothetical protein